MKRLLFCIIALCFAVPQVNAMTGEEIIRKSTSLYREGINNETEVVHITITSGSQTKEKALIRYTQYDSEKTKVAIAFKEPAIDKGQKMSIWLEPKGKVEQWLKLPSKEAPLQISAVNQNNIFVGNITHEIARLLAREPVELFAYRILNQNIQQSVIEATPKPGTESGFTKRLLYLNKGLAVTKVEYYNSAGLAKVQINQRRRVNERTGWWRVDWITIEDKQRGDWTMLTITDRAINERLQTEIFAKDFLTSKRY